MTTSLRILSVALLAAATSPLAGCTTHYIPNTDVEDTSENREAVLFCEKYRKAVERRDIPLLLTLISPRYYEDGGNADASDDLDYAGMREYLQTQLTQAKAIRYEIRYRRVLGSKDTERVFVDYTYSASYKVPGIEDKDEWRRTVSENRLELIRCAGLSQELKTAHNCEGTTFKISGGM
ncbi:MAG: hypothetical protein HY898_08605 [Deltaproteobacteria bacterium]|nr:hypothetical protein [Deltaproteobacteria bacterium]